MSYPSFDGGSHGSHEWVAVGQWHDFEFVGGGPVEGSKTGSYRLGDRVDHFYIIRACQLCPEVWWQEYKPETAISGTPVDVE